MPIIALDRYSYFLENPWIRRILNQCLNSDKIMEVTEAHQQIAEFQLPDLERKQADETVKHINAVLRAICTVNRLIAREKNRDRLA